MDKKLLRPPQLFFTLLLYFSAALAPGLGGRESPLAALALGALCVPVLLAARPLAGREPAALLAPLGRVGSAVACGALVLLCLLAAADALRPRGWR